MSAAGAERAKAINEAPIPEPSFGLLETIGSFTDPRGVMSRAVEKYGDTMR